MYTLTPRKIIIKTTFEYKERWKSHGGGLVVQPLAFEATRFRFRQGKNGYTHWIGLLEIFTVLPTVLFEYICFV